MAVDAFKIPRNCLRLVLLCRFAVLLCATESCTKLDLNKSHASMRMVGHVFSETTCPSQLRCVSDCMTSPECLSYNWLKEAKVCELNTENSTTSPNSLVYAGIDYVYSDISVWSKTIAKGCSPNGFSKNEHCIAGSHCVTVCSYPHVENAYAVTKSTRYPGGTWTYACNDGYLMTGTTSTITCLADGSWSDIQCKRACPTETPSHANAVVVDNNGSRFVGDIRIYECSHGYLMTGTGDSTITCQDTGSWSDVIFQCDRVCPELTADTEYVIFNDSITLGDSATNVVNDTRAYSCVHGRSVLLGTSNEIMCQEDGTWSNHSCSPCKPDCYCGRLDEDCAALCEFEWYATNVFLHLRGRLEVRHCSDPNSQWGVICDHCFNEDGCGINIVEENGIVACRMLDFSSDYMRRSAIVEPPNGTVCLMSQVKCTGEESSILQCPEYQCDNNCTLLRKPVSVSCWK